MQIVEKISQERLNAPKIALDYLRGEKHAASFFSPLPKNLDSLCKTLPTFNWEKDKRAKLARIAANYQKEYGGSPASIKNAEKFTEPNSFAIVTGQQPGFLLGPMLSLLKAASTVRLALLLQEKGLPAIPIFWNHSEDHDLEEVNHAYFPNEHLDLQKFRLPYANEKKFLYEIKLDHAAVELFESLAGVIPSSEFKSAALELFRPREGKSISQETSRILLTLFAKQGLVVLEPQKLRELSAPALARALQIKEGLTESVAQIRRSLEQAGYKPTLGEDQALLFENVGGARLRLEFRDKLWHLPSGKNLSSAELASLIEKEPERFSPGALLRPLTQCESIPVAAYVGGTTELAYSGENFSLFAKTGTTAPVLFPRFSASFLESSTQKALERFKLKASAALQPFEALESSLPSPSTDSAEDLSLLEKEIQSRLAALENSVRALDSTLLGPLERTRKQASESLLSLREKIIRAAANRDGTGRRQIKKISASLFPRELPQERVINPLYFFSRHGESFLQELLEILDPFEREHCFVSLASKHENNKEN